MEKHIVQIHHEFEDGHTNFVAQREISSHDEMSTWVSELWEGDPPPMCSQFMACVEGSRHFLMMAKQ